jgi:hypothetical protein
VEEVITQFFFTALAATTRMHWAVERKQKKSMTWATAVQIDKLPDCAIAKMSSFDFVTTVANAI